VTNPFVYNEWLEMSRINDRKIFETAEQLSCCPHMNILKIFQVMAAVINASMQQVKLLARPETCRTLW
jgi:hypothetical protein